MRTRPQRSRPADNRLRELTLVAVVATAVAVAATAATGRSSTEVPSEAWDGLVGERPTDVMLGQRMIVVLRAPSLADRVARAGGRASDREERAWSRSALSAQKLFIARMSTQGALLQPEFTYTRVLNGFSAVLEPRTAALLERAPEVEGVYPVRAAFPASVSSRLLADAAFAPGLGRRPDVGLPGFDGRGVTVALLDTGVDRGQPYLRGRIQGGVDIVGEAQGAVKSDDGLAAANPDEPLELERHGTQLAGIVVGAGGPSSLAGVATGATITPIRVAGWQRDATGRWAVYSRTDQLIAGLEHAVDPNGDGDAHDAARVALVGVVERFAGFANGPLARAAGGALRLDTLVVAPAGNEGPGGPGFGKLAGPGGAPAALTVGAADLRVAQERSRVVVRAGLNVLLDRVLPLAGAVAPDEALTLPVGVPGRVSGEDGGPPVLADFFDRDGFSRVAGRAAVVRPGGDPAAAVGAAARAGAAAVVLYGERVPAGGLGVDERIPVPVVAIPEEVADAVLAARARGAATGVSLGRARVVAAPTARSVAPFSSRGLAFDGRVKPELLAAGVGIATSEPGANEDGSPRYGTVNGSSAAAAIVAGAAALLAQARSDVGAAALKSLLAGSARALEDTGVAAQGTGLVDVGAAAVAEVVTDPAALAFPRATTRDWQETRRVTVRNVSARTVRVEVTVERRGFPAADTAVVATPARLVLRPGKSARIRVRASVPAPAFGGAPAEGHVVLTAQNGRRVRVPFAIAFGPPDAPLLATVALADTAAQPSETRPWVLSLRAGRLRTIGGSDEVQPVDRLDVELWTAEGERVGLLARLRNLLPGRYAFGVTGHDADGERLEPGVYVLRLVAHPPAGRPTTKSLQFQIK